MRFRPSTIASSLLWAFVYGAALECLRVLVAEKLPKLQQLDALEAETDELRDALAVARSSVTARGEMIAKLDDEVAAVTRQRDDLREQLATFHHNRGGVQ